jgi:RNA polymerase sigma-54 factor
MAIEHKLELKLAQKLILTPQLQQSIKLLQLPLLELSLTLTKELLENPLLEDVVEREPDGKSETSDRAEAETGEPAQEFSEDTEAPLEKIFGFTTEEYFEERGSDGRDLGYFTSGMEAQIPFDHSSKQMDLYEYLVWQLRLSRVSEKIRQTAEVVIGNLNRDGYLQESVQEIAKLAETDVETAEEAIAFVQKLDPPGVAAKDLQECLLLQLKPLNLENTLVEKILTEEFSELETKKYKKLAVKFKVSLEEVLAAVKIIEGLEPRPGRNYSSEETVNIVPDVYVSDSDGKFVIILNDENIPKLRLSNYYRKMLSKKNQLGEKEREYLEEKLRAAVWLLKSLDQRNKTIYRVTESILKFQEDFFRKESKEIKPLNLKDIAADLNMHESTISRVTSNKYIQCPQGLFGFRFFFSNAVQSSDGEVSSVTVKNHIKQFILGEDSKAPLNDKNIVEQLKAQNITIARRTVAKYREELKIQPHSRRKKWT